jgi:hypothetical protein
MNLYHDQNQDQAAYETLRKLYLSTKSDIMRHVVENAMIQLLRKGVRPCHEK